MKKMHFLLALLTFSLFACKKSDDPIVNPSYTCTTCKQTPDALAANNSSSKGIYKGVEIGSSGTIMFDIANNGNTITGVMVIDGTTVNLTSAVSWVAGQPYIADFTGTLNGGPVTIHLSIGVSGGAPTVTSANIPGHPNATLTVIKETSTSLVECFEGSYSTTLPETGTFNIILLRSLGVWGAVARKTGGTAANDDHVDGTFSNNKLMTTNGSGASVVVGTLNIDQLSGSSIDGNNKTVTITGRRTL